MVRFIWLESLFPGQVKIWKGSKLDVVSIKAILSWSPWERTDKTKTAEASLMRICKWSLPTCTLKMKSEECHSSLCAYANSVNGISLSNFILSNELKRVQRRSLLCVKIKKALDTIHTLRHMHTTKCPYTATKEFWVVQIDIQEISEARWNYRRNFPTKEDF